MSKSRKISAYICIGILVCLMLTILVRTMTRQILVKKLGMDNVFTQIILFDNENMQMSVLEEEQEQVENKIDWSTLYPFADEDIQDEDMQPNFLNRVEDKVNSITSNIDYYTSDFLIGYDIWVKLHILFQKITNWDMKYVSGIKVVNMNNGYMAYTEPLIDASDIAEMAASASDFNKFLGQKGIDFYYINVGSKVDPDNKQLSGTAFLNEHTNENGDNLLRALQDYGVNTVDMRKLMKDDGLDWYESYYITDHHWTNRTGLWCASKLAEMLNEKSGFNYNLSLFEEDSYNIERYEDFWFGCQAREVKLVGCQKEAFEMITPKFDTNFYVSIPSKNYEKSGSYEETIISISLFEQIKKYTNSDFLDKKGPYDIPVWNNDALGIIVNSTTIENKDKKILILQDSFGWFLTTYLACDTGEIDLIYPMAFDGSIREYINQTNPDVVLMMYCERSIDPIDWNTHKSSFDLR